MALVLLGPYRQPWLGLKDGLGGHDVYAQERNAREILEYLGVKAKASSSRADAVIAAVGPAMGLVARS